MPKPRGWRIALAALLVAACDRGQRDKSRALVPAPAPLPAKAGCTVAPIPTKVPLAPKRLVAVGDLHGDFEATRAALRAAGAIDERDAWIGGDLVIVQTGDVLDRGDDESKILELLERLDGEARKAGGAVIQLLGNHELMNAARDYRYVTPAGMRDFGGARERALDPGGAWAKRLARFNVVAIVGDTVFSHAGVLPEWVNRVDEINLTSRCWLDGQAGGAGEPPIALTSDTSPVWTREYGMPEVACQQVDIALAMVGAKRMVVGHTVQQNGVNAACDGKLWRIDVGLAKLYGGPIEVLELGDSPRVVKGSRP
jgi:hypothetical protein